MSSISVQQLSYIHPDKEVLFQDISFSVEPMGKVGLVGNNGSGKSTLLQIMAQRLTPSIGVVVSKSEPYYVPQHFGQYNSLTVAEALRIDGKIIALHSILSGDSSDKNFAMLNDDWTIEERAMAALTLWGMEHLSLSQSLEGLSGGEKTRVFLSGIDIHEPDIVLMDEPTNHLDYEIRDQVYEMLSSSRATMVVVSHDRVLLNLLSAIYELNHNKITYYAGNYDFYKEEKEVFLDSLQGKLDEQEKQLRQAKKIARETLERKQKHESRGKKSNLKKGVGKMAMNTFQDKAEKSRSKLGDIHDNKMEFISESITEIRTAIPDIKAMKLDFDDSGLHTGKTLITAKNINFKYDSEYLWKEDVNFQIKSGERILIKGKNGAGKTTLIKLITQKLLPSRGILDSADFTSIYLDQEYSIIKDNLTVLEQIESFNSGGLYEYEIKTILNRFLFTEKTWDKACLKLSGGEKMKLALCCLMVTTHTPDVFILDEPTNNIDIQNVEILMNTIRDYKGTVLLISHDEYFINEIGIDYSIELAV